jgi:hypothetical protein
MSPFVLRRLPALLLIAAILAVPAARADIEFAGIIEAGGDPTFGLDDTDTKFVKWVTTGQKFNDWTITNYDEKSQTLLLTKGDAKMTLHLKDAVIKEAAPSKIEGNVVIKLGDKTISQALALEADRASVIPLDNGVILKVTLRKQPSGDVRYELSTERTPGADGQAGEVLGHSMIDASPTTAVGIGVGGPDGDTGSFSFTPKAAVPAPTPAVPADGPAAPAAPEAPAAPAPPDAPLVP